MSKSKTVTLPREVVEQALDALWNTAHGDPCFGKHVRNSMEALIAAMEQQPNHILDAGNMTLEGWKLVPVEPTQEMLDAYIHMQGRFSSARSDWAAMLAAAPQPQTTEQSSAVEQQQGEQEPAVEHELKDVRCECCGYMTNHREHMGCIRAAHTKREPLENEQARRIYNSATYSASLAVFMTRIDAEHQDADDKGVSGWLQEAEDRVKHRTIDAAHEIGQEAAPQPPALGRPQSDPSPYLWYDPENGDTWTQEAVDEGFCSTDSLIPLYTK